MYIDMRARYSDCALANHSVSTYHVYTRVMTHARTHMRIDGYSDCAQAHTRPVGTVGQIYEFWFDVVYSPV